MDITRVVLVVLDGVGAGEAPDAEAYGDRGSNSLGHVAAAIGGLALPHFEQLGLGNITQIVGVAPCERAQGAYGKMAEQSVGKDSISGHWELAGVISEKAMPTYPKGFPPDLISAFEYAVGRGTLGNKAASGTEIIQELGEEHQRTGKLILYTSADSVFQLAAHEEIIPVAELYRICEIARRLLTGPHTVGRVIARPFVGTPGSYRRTSGRRDFSLQPTGPTILDRLAESGQTVVAVGKIDDLFAGRGITTAIHTASNREGMAQTIACLDSVSAGLIFVNLVECDMIYGHRKDAYGYGRALQEIDAWLPEVQARMQKEDLLIISADHGVDPTTPGSDHTREYVPLLVVGAQVKGGVNLGVRDSFADVGATIAGVLRVPGLRCGKSFASEIE